MTKVELLGELLIAPVMITPTKPLLPSHVKGLLWVDVLYRSSRLVGDVTYHWNPRGPNLAGQTIGFWEYLDRRHDDVDYSRLSEDDLGELYVKFHAETQELPPYEAIRPYVERVENDGWIHPSSRRMIESWSEQLSVLGVIDPGLSVDRALPLSSNELLDKLSELGLCLDHRSFGGGAYLDGTRWGMPLRKVASPDGQANYLLMLLCDLISMATRYSSILLVHDTDLDQDYVLLERVLREFGAQTSRLSLGRVPISGVVQSSRFGSWEGITLSSLARACLQDFGIETYRLGMRLYFIAMLGQGAKESFRMDLLRRAMYRAERLLGAAGSNIELAAAVAEHRVPQGWIDPYRLTTGLQRSRPAVPVQELLRSVYL